MKALIEEMEAKIKQLEYAKTTVKTAGDLHYIDGQIQGLFFAIVQLRKAAK